MNAAPAQLESAPRHRWLLWTVIILAGQISFIFWLGARNPLESRPPHATPPTALASEYSPELAALKDPTLFVLPHENSFSGAAGRLAPRPGYLAADWTEPLRWLPLPAEKLGASFRQFVADNPAPAPTLTEKIAPKIPALDFPADFFPLPAQSTLRIEGALAARPPLAPLELKSWPATDVLAASEVRVLVDAAGNVLSAILLASSGAPEADARALELARAARFEPLPDGARERLAHPLANLVRGKMIFQWHTTLALEPPANP
jgi:TonB family protein